MNHPSTVIEETTRLLLGAGCRIPFTSENGGQILCWLCSEYHESLREFSKDRKTASMTSPSEEESVRWLVSLGIISSIEEGSRLLSRLHETSITGPLFIEAVHIIEAVRILATTPNGSDGTTNAHSDITGLTEATGPVVARMNSLFAREQHTFTPSTMEQFPEVPANDELASLIEKFSSESQDLSATLAHFQSLDEDLPGVEDVSHTLKDMSVHRQVMANQAEDLSTEAENHWVSITPCFDVQHDRKMGSYLETTGLFEARISGNELEEAAHQTRKLLDDTSIPDMLKMLDIELKKVGSQRKVLSST